MPPLVGSNTERVVTGACLVGQITYVGPGAEERLQFGGVQKGGSAITWICPNAELPRVYEAVELRPADLILERRVSDIDTLCLLLGIFHVRLNVARQRRRFNMYRCVV